MPDNRMRIVTGKLTPRQLRVLTSMAQLNLTVPELCRENAIITLDEQDDLTEALSAVFKACKVTLARHDMPLPSVYWATDPRGGLDNPPAL